MMLEPIVQDFHNEESSRRLIVNMQSCPDQECKVRSCEIKDNGFRNRTTFGEGAELDSVFCPEVADALKECLESLRNQTEVVSLPSFLLELPGLTLHGIHLIATKLKNDSINIIARVGTFLGGINRAFAIDVGFDDHVTTQTQTLASQVLEDIALPLLDICSFAAKDIDAKDHPLRKFGERLNLHSHQIHFRIELLKRFVEQEGQKRQRLEAIPCRVQNGYNGLLS